MAALVTYEHDGSVATITMDDGKVNALSLAMLTEVRAALEQAAGDGAVVVLAGREGRFSGGFDLGVLNAGGPDAVTMLRSGFELAERVLSFPTPVVMACTGHAVAMGSFLLLSGDHLIGADGPFKITANEVAIGLTLPWAAIEIMRNRLTPAHFARAANLAEVFSPAAAVTAGYLDRVVRPDEVLGAAHETATAFTQLDLAAHAGTKLRVREPVLRALRAAIVDEFGGGT
jgi:enoyl-CoA hydratase